MIKLNSEFLNPHTQYDESLMTIMTANNLNLILLNGLHKAIVGSVIVLLPIGAKIARTELAAS